MKLPQGWGLQFKDFVKGLIMAIGVPGLTYIQQSIPDYHLPIYAQLAISAFISYIIKNYFTNDVKEAQKTLDKAQLKLDAKQPATT